MNDLKGKKLLILGGISLSNEIIKHAKELGLDVYVTDYLECSPAKKQADKSFMVSTTDVEELSKLIKKEEVDGLLTGFVDLILPYYQEACERNNLPCYASKEQIDILTDKIKFKNLCRRFDVPVVEEYIINRPIKKEEIESLKYPVLLKPADNSGGKGINICENAKKFEEIYHKSLSFSPSKKVLVERYMKAEEASIFYLIKDGEFYLTAMGDRHVKYFKDGNIPLPVGYTFPSKYLENYQNNLNDKVIQMLKSIGIKNGMLFIQSFIEDGECIFYEPGFRLTGSLEYKIIAHSSGYNPMQEMIQYAVKGEMADLDIKKLVNPNFENYYCKITFIAKPGKIGKIIGVDKVLEMDNVLDVVLTYNEGDIIPEKAIGTLAQVVIRVFAFAKIKEDLANLIRKIQESISVKSENGDNMILLNLELEDFA